MSRGRPRKLGTVAPTEESYSEPETIVGAYLAKLCGVPGCQMRVHVEEARILLRVLETDHQLKLVKG